MSDYYSLNENKFPFFLSAFYIFIIIIFFIYFFNYNTLYIRLALVTRLQLNCHISCKEKRIICILKNNTEKTIINLKKKLFEYKFELRTYF